MTKQNNIERVQDLLGRGLMTLDQANVELVLLERVRLIRGRLSRETRKALNGAVKEGVLGHMTKKGLRPEAYYHPTFEYMAKSQRKECEKKRHKDICGIIS